MPYYDEFFAVNSVSDSLFILIKIDFISSFAQKELKIY